MHQDSLGSALPAPGGDVHDGVAVAAGDGQPFGAAPLAGDRLSPSRQAPPGDVPGGDLVPAGGQLRLLATEVLHQQILEAEARRTAALLDAETVESADLGQVVA